jgi:hypothetical protein
MSVKKIFMTLIVIVACVMIGAFILNVLMPNVATTLVNATEEQIYNATGISFDFNNDGDYGNGQTTTYQGTQSAGEETGINGQNVTGFN